MIPTQTSGIRKAWDAIAVNFDRYVTPAANWALAKEALQLAGLKPGMQFLDVASGSGALCLPAARMGAEVVAVDISPVMIERLHARAEEEGLSHIEGKVMDGHHLELEDDRFDMSGSQFGVMLFPDFMQGLHEMVRVTRKGGTVFLVCFGPMQKVEFLGAFFQAVKKVVPQFSGLSPDTPPLPFQVSAEGVLQKKMQEAGLRNVRVEQVIHELTFHSGKEMWNWVTSSNPIAMEKISGLNEQQRTQVIQVLDEMIRERHTLQAAVQIGIGEK